LVRDLASLAELFRSTIAAAPFDWEGQEIRLTISLGTSMSHSPGPSVQSLLTSADEA